MKSRRSVCCSIAFALATLLITLVAAQSNSATAAKQVVDAYPQAPSALLAMGAEQAALKFAKPVSYASGGQYSYSVAIKDVNADGHPDLIVVNNSVTVFLGNGDGSFRAPVSYSSGFDSSVSGGVADVNGDGKPDVFVVNSCQNDSCSNGGVALLLGNGDGTFQAPVSYSSGGYWATSAAILDVNGDGRPDLIVGNCAAVSATNCNSNDEGVVAVLLGNGDGTFGTPQPYLSGGDWVTAVQIADVNGDGKPDLIATNICEINGECIDGGAVSVLLGNGDGTFRPAEVYGSGGTEPNSVAVADINADGKLDLVVANQCFNCGNGGTVGILLGNGDGTFQPVQSLPSGGWSAVSIAVGDINGDGNPDLVVTNCGTTEANCKHEGALDGKGVIAVLVGNGDGTFRAPVTFSSGGYSVSAIAIADLNGDKRPDLVAVNNCSALKACQSSIASVMLNQFEAITTTQLTSSLNPSHVNQSVTFTATITASSPVPNGSEVTFYTGTTTLGTATTKNGVATLTTSFSKAKTFVVKAQYAGDVFHKASSKTVKQIVIP